MTIENIIQVLGLEVFTGTALLQRPVKGAYASDMLSDVMGRAKEGDLWITMQTHKNIVAVASLKDIAAVLIVNGGKPADDALALAESEKIILLGTHEGTYTLCGRLYQLMERDAMV